MKTWLIYLLIFLFGVMWFTGCSPELGKWLFDKGLVEDDYRFGDLYRLSNLPQFKVPVEKCTMPPDTGRRKVHLVLSGDSFTEEGRVERGHFGTEAYSRTMISRPASVTLVPDTKHILIIETVERHLRERFLSPWNSLHVSKDNENSDSGLNWSEIRTEAARHAFSAERQESVLFSNAFFTRIKEWKALLNYHLLGRVNDNVKLSRDGRHIFYGLDSNPGISSMFEEVTDEEIDVLVSHINQTYHSYRRRGFDQVYLSIIPNKTTILGQDLGTYNHLIERIQQHPKLEMPYIDMLKPLMKGGESYFDKGDTHWNCQGKQAWIDKINALTL